MSTTVIALSCLAGAWFLGFFVYGVTRKDVDPSMMDGVVRFMIAVVPAMVMLAYGPVADLQAWAQTVQVERVAAETKACRTLSAERYILGDRVLCRDGQSRLYAMP